MPIERLTLEQIVRYCVEGLAVLSIFIEISPIKINPWSAIARWVGKAVNRELYSELEKQSKRLDAIEKAVENGARKEDERAATAARSRIVIFGDDLLNGRKKTKDHFNQIMIDIDEYTAYCASHPGYRNSVAEHTIKLVEDEYDLCLSGVHSFLK